jgi:hypothetical protein
MEIRTGKSLSRDAFNIFGRDGAGGTGGTGTLSISRDRHDQGCYDMTALLKIWRNIVGIYTKCNLTFPSDKLVALSGVAKSMKQAFNDGYCAGLWRRDLVADLMWYVDIPSGIRESGPDTIPYRAPSWSWACRDGIIKWWKDPIIEQQSTDIIRCDVKTVTADQTGAVVHGSLKLSGWLVRIQLRNPLGGDWEICLNGRWVELRNFPFKLDCCHASFQLRWPWENDYDAYGEMRDELWDSLVKLDCCLMSSQLVCLPLLPCLSSFEPTCVPCLLLVPTGITYGQFRRIGLVDLWLTLDDILSPQHPRNESWLEYGSVSDDGKYTITII